MKTSRRLAVAVTDSMSCMFLKGQLAAARQHGFEVGLVSPPGPTAERLAADENATLLPVRMARAMSPGRDVMALLQLVRTLRRFRPTIVNAGTPKAGFLTMVAAWLVRVPCRIYTLRGLYLETASGPRRWLLGMCETIACRLADRVLCNSFSLRTQAIALGLVAPEKITVLGSGSSNGVDVGRYHLSPELRQRAREIRARLGIPLDGFVVGFVGRLVPDKGIGELLDACVRLATESPELHLLLIGWAEHDGLAATITRLRERDRRLHLVGHVENPAEYYAAMDLLALPTYREGFPNVALEAAAMELPVVATNVTGCTDAVIAGVTGTLVPPRDVPALASAIQTYLDDPQLRVVHGRQGRARVEREFLPQRIWDALHQEYCAVLQSKGLVCPPSVQVSLQVAP